MVDSFLIFYLYTEVTIFSICAISPRNKISLWLSAVLTPLIFSVLFIFLVGVMSSAYNAGRVIAQIFIPSIIMGIVIFFQLDKRMKKNETGDNYTAIQSVLISSLLFFLGYAIYDGIIN